MAALASGRKGAPINRERRNGLVILFLLVCFALVNVVIHILANMQKGGE